MFWQKDLATVTQELNTNSQQGLSSEHAAELLKEQGPNALPVAKKRPLWKIIVKHFFEPFMLVLLALLVVVCVLQEWPELVVIALIMIVEVCLSTYQEIKAETSLAALKKLVKEQAVVIRDGQKMTVATQELVVGDLVYLEAGMFVPADVRIVQAFNLQTDESMLTGESNPVVKTTMAIKQQQLVLADQTNMAFMSTTIVSGSGSAFVVATGVKTEIGKINKLLQAEKEPRSPLNQQMIALIRTVSIIAVILGIIFFFIQRFVNFAVWTEALVFAIALVIAVVPEGLLVIITVALSLGSNQMAKKHAIVKQLNAVETLGQVNVICTDKTGTLTENKMTVQQYWLHQTIMPASAFANHSQQAKLFLECLILANNGHITHGKLIGDPTETALLAWAETLKIASAEVQTSFPRIHELPFDSDRKLMSTINHYEAEKYLFIKGAPETLIDRCTHILLGNETIKITSEIKAQIINNIFLMSQQALRVLGCAYKPISSAHDFNDLAVMEQNLIFLGLVGMIDPPRKEVSAVLLTTEQAGIVTKMITGDHLNTAIAIAQQLKILTSADQAITGMQLEQMSDEQLAHDINKYHVFARVSPEHKVRIVKALQNNSNIVAMTGDGVNDAPSLKAADIGVAMGITGTDVAKEAAQMVLTDDNFVTIVDAIEVGRNIYSKLKNSICFILITNFSQVLAIILGAVFQVGNLLAPLQILWINLIVESILAITMSMGPNNPQLMNTKPIRKRTSVLSGNLLTIIVMSFLLGWIILLTALYLPVPPNSGFIYCFIIMVNAPLFYGISFNFSSKASMFNKLLFKNYAFWWAMLLSFILNAFIIFVPEIKLVFGVKVNINFLTWFYCLLISMIPLVVLECYKIGRELFEKVVVIRYLKGYNK